VLKNQAVFSYSWVTWYPVCACLRLSAPVCACLRLSAPVCACLRALAHRQMRWRTGRCVGAQADALAHRRIQWRTDRFESGHAGLEI